MRTLLTILVTLAILLGGHAVADAPILTKGQNLRVMPVGDSITLGKGECVGGYRRILYEWLIAHGYAITYVGKQNIHPNKSYPDLNASDGSILWHEGYGSLRTDQTLNGGKAEGQTAPPLATSLANFKPDVVLLMIGTNDILQNHELDGLENRLEQILEAIYTYNPKITVLVASIPPLGGWSRVGQETRAKVYNGAIPTLVAKEQAQGRSAVFVDVHQALSFPGALAGDQVHPTSMGYAKMAQAWYQALTGDALPAIDPKNPLQLPPPLPRQPASATSTSAPASSATNNAAPSAPATP